MRKIVHHGARLLVPFSAALGLFLLTGCRIARPDIASDDTFFVPETAMTRQAPEPEIAVTPEKPPPIRAEREITSLEQSQREQAARIESIAARLDSLRSARSRVRPDSVVEPPRMVPRVVPKPKPSAEGGRTVGEAEKMYAARNYEGTIKLCQDLIQAGLKKGTETRCYFVMGASHYRLKEYGLAAASLKKALEFGSSPKRADVTFLLGLTYKQLGMTDEAISMYQMALKESPGSDLARAIRQELDRSLRKR